MSGPEEVIIGVDVGTTAVKVAAFDVHGEPGQLPTALREYPLQQPEPGWQVQDPLTMLAAVDAAVAECVGLLGSARILALSLSTAMHGLIGLDSQMRPLTPLITWADSRARDQARELGDTARPSSFSGSPGPRCTR
jgi:gluconokinase